MQASPMRRAVSSTNAAGDTSAASSDEDDEPNDVDNETHEPMNPSLSMTITMRLAIETSKGQRAHFPASQCLSQVTVRLCHVGYTECIMMKCGLWPIIGPALARHAQIELCGKRWQGISRITNTAWVLSAFQEVMISS